MRASRVAPLIGLVSLVGCAGVLGFDDFLAGTAVPDAGDPSEGGVTDAPAPNQESASADWYVSADQGDDGNDGTSTDRPLKSIRRALTLAGATTDRRKIAVCQGSYKEAHIDLIGPFDLRGGYDCAFWRRPVSNDSATGTSFTSVSTLVNAALEPDSFIKLESDQAGAPRLDGWTVTGTNVGSVVLTVGAAHLKELAIVNATMPSSSNDLWTAGVSMNRGTGDAPLVEHCAVTVNQSDSAAYPGAKGAFGVGLRGPGVLRRNMVLVRNVRGNCQGLVLVGANPVTLTENQIEVLSCVHPTGSRLVGITSSDSEAVSVGNSVLFEGPGTEDDAGVAGVSGVLVAGTGSYVSDRDRVIGPSLLFPPAQSLEFLGFFERSPGVLRHVVNASIVLDGSFTIAEADGIVVAPPSSMLVAHNSMYFTGGTGTPKNMRGIYVLDPGNTGPAGLTVDSNLVVTNAAEMMFLRAACPTEGFTALDHNRYAGMDAAVRGPGCAAGAGPTDAKPGAVDSVSFPCPNGDCRTLFESGARGAVLQGMGLRLTDAGCVGLQVPSIPAVTVDGQGRPRSDGGMTTAGAFEPTCN